MGIALPLKTSSQPSQPAATRHGAMEPAAARPAAAAGGSLSPLAIPPAAAAAAPLSVLLVDNFDSFTNNLCQLLGALNQSTPPLVVTNATPWAEVQRLIAAHKVEAIVISPGPGSPANVEDFGVCGQVLRDCAHIPTLGVCLGHQGLALLHGAEVVRAPEPVHGRLSAITVLELDDGAEEGGGSAQRLFRGIRSGFSAVRYHSLVVRSSTLPPTLLPLAETADDEASKLLMAFKVANAPQWGVQYHPESICTEHGRTLLGNFLAIARSFNSAKANLKAAAVGATAAPQNKPAAGTGTAVLSRPETPVEAEAGGNAAAASLSNSSISTPAAAAPQVTLQLLVDSSPFPESEAAGQQIDFPADVYAALYANPSQSATGDEAEAGAPTFWLDSATAGAFLYIDERF